MLTRSRPLFLRRPLHGDTLIEILVAVLILGVAVTVVLGALADSALLSSTHRSDATASTLLKDYAEAIESTVANGGYTPCASPSSYSSPAGFTATTGFTASVTSVQYWSGSSFTTSCSPDSGLQRLSLQVTDSARAAQSVQIVLRKPCRETDSSC